MKIDRVLLLIFMLALLAVTIFSVDVLIEKNQQIAELKAQVVEWQDVSMRAVAARGWWNGVDIQKTTDITPEILRRALDKCYATPTGDRDRNQPGCRGSMSSAF